MTKITAGMSSTTKRNVSDELLLRFFTLREFFNEFLSNTFGVANLPPRKSSLILVVSHNHHAAVHVLMLQAYRVNATLCHSNELCLYT